MYELSTELSVLLWSCLLYVAQIHIAAVGADVCNGIPWALGNREHQPSLPDWLTRARRAQSNMTENLLPFACLVLIIQLSGKSGEWSVLGAQIFLGARVAYCLLYIFGVKVVRSIAFMAGLAGMLMVAFELLR